VRTLATVLLCSLLGSCTFLRENVEPAFNEVKYALFGTKQTIQLEPQEAKQLADAAFAALDAQIPDTVTPETFVVVDATALQGAIEFLSSKQEKLEVHFENAPQLLQTEIARLAAERGWAPIANEAIEAAARQCGHQDIAAALFTPDSRQQLAEALGKTRSGVAQQILYADLIFFGDAEHGARAHFRLTLRCASVAGQEQWIAEHTIDKSLPFRGVLSHLQDWLDGGKQTGDAAANAADAINKGKTLWQTASGFLSWL